MKVNGKVLFSFSLCVIVSLFLFGCPAPVIKTNMLMPAAYGEAAKLRKVAVMPFEGPEGKEFVAQVESILASVKINDSQYFELVDRMTIDKVLAEHKLSQTGLVEPQTAAKIGNFIGAKGIYVGTITASDVSESAYIETRKECSRSVRKFDPKGKPYEECVKWREYIVPCTKRIAAFEVIPKIINVESSRIAYSNTLSGKAEAASCLDRPSSLGNKAEMKIKAQQAALAQFRKDIAPYYVTVAVKLMDSPEGIVIPGDKEKFKNSISFAKNNRLDRACELWGEVKTQSPQCLAVLYNLGVCAEVAGKLPEALNLYNEADRRLSKPDDRISAALARVKEAIEKQKSLKEQMAK